jgi:hypothetical protein
VWDYETTYASKDVAFAVFRMEHCLMSFPCLEDHLLIHFLRLVKRQGVHDHFGRRLSHDVAHFVEIDEVLLAHELVLDTVVEVGLLPRGRLGKLEMLLECGEAIRSNFSGSDGVVCLLSRHS